MAVAKKEADGSEQIRYATNNAFISVLGSPLCESKKLKIMNTNNDTFINENKEIFLSKIIILITIILCILAGYDALEILLQRIKIGTQNEILEQLVFILISFFLLYGSFIYQFTRLGFLRRRKKHRPASLRELRTSLSNAGGGLTILIPSYKEEPSVITQTLLSAALQVGKERRVVLLIDNPPHVSDVGEKKLLEQTRDLIPMINKMLVSQAENIECEFDLYQERMQNGCINFDKESIYLADLYMKIAGWHESKANEYNVKNHTDKLFIEKVHKEPAKHYFQYAEEIYHRVEVGHNYLGKEELDEEYLYLCELFKVEITSFERKRFVNLSHEENKAMNINSYLGLMGCNYNIGFSPEGYIIENASTEKADIFVPDAEFIITLDADSIISHDYALRLTHELNKPEHQRTAVIQTPYSAIPGASIDLERVAGATTDIQYNIHQGFTKYSATYWVGANALIRRSALEDIMTVDTERGYEIRRYIQDRTVIEDTESSIDLIEKGWRLVNYPERLAYSATPPDFGSLLIQRRRWANGGLIILPKLLRNLCLSFWKRGKTVEGIVRVHYLISIAAINIGLVLLFLLPFEENMGSLWLPLSAVPYFYLYGRDLVQINYRWSDLYRVYALNLMLIPVNLGGVFKSIEQGITKKKIPFGRTPKVSGRTASPPLYVFAVFLLTGLCLVTGVVDAFMGRWLHAIFSTMNGSLLLYAVVRFLKWKDSLSDIKNGLNDIYVTNKKYEQRRKRYKYHI